MVISVLAVKTSKIHVHKSSSENDMNAKKDAVISERYRDGNVREKRRHGVAYRRPTGLDATHSIRQLICDRSPANRQDRRTGGG